MGARGDALTVEFGEGRSVVLEGGRRLAEVGTWGIGGPAEWLAEVTTVDEMAAVLRFCHSNAIRALVIGKGSNCLNAIRALVIGKGSNCLFVSRGSISFLYPFPSLRCLSGSATATPSARWFCHSNAIRALVIGKGSNCLFVSRGSISFLYPFPSLRCLSGSATATPSARWFCHSNAIRALVIGKGSNCLFVSRGSISFLYPFPSLRCLSGSATATPSARWFCHSNAIRALVIGKGSNCLFVSRGSISFLYPFPSLRCLSGSATATPSARWFCHSNAIRALVIGKGSNCLFVSWGAISFLFCHSNSIRAVVIGKGSNCLFEDRGFKGCHGAEGYDAVVQVGGGYPFNLLGVECSRDGLSGLEFAGGIPGTVGGAVFMNAGADGQETADCLLSVDVLSSTGDLLSFPRTDLTFAYRHSPFQRMPDCAAIVGATFGLKRSSEARDRQRRYMDRRRQSQPIADRSVGCIFRNPAPPLGSAPCSISSPPVGSSPPAGLAAAGASAVTLPASAGALIDRAGLKGLHVGDAFVSPMHANFLVNGGACSSEDMEGLIVEVKRRVREEFGVELVEEAPPSSTEDESAPASQQSTSLPSSFTEAKTSLLDALKAAVKPALAALLISAVLAAGAPDAALAAMGGGRIGGSGFGASRMRSYAPPPSAPRGGGYSYNAPPVIVGPSVPFFAPSPFFFFGPSIAYGGGGGGGIFNLLVIGIVIWFVSQSVMGFLSSAQEEGVWQETQRSSVVRLQVGLLGSARRLQRDLDRIADRADASSPEGLHYILQETVLALLRNPDYCIYGFSSSEVNNDSYAGEAAFNRMSMEERSKFKEETLVNVDGIRRRITRKPSQDRMNSEYIVVTVLAAAEGTFRLPEIKSSSDLREALTRLGSVPADELQAVEVLWTPQDDEDTLTERDLLVDFPRLRPL
ncbi:unnamed protein product [Closterium sp. NIES-64]|nr:unnamed protein product [Closterium sp. NIES-64]